MDVIAHVIRGKLNDAPTSIPLRSTHLCILMFMIVDAAVILILMCRNIVNVAIQIPQLFKAHREGTSEVFWDFLWKEIIGLVVLVGTGVIWGLLAAGVFGTAA